MNMVEKVARAMMVAKNAGDYWDEMSDDSDVDYIGRTEALKMAKAAIEAMREPTNDMVEAWRAHLQQGMRFEMAFRRHAWPAAIDAALDEHS